MKCEEMKENLWSYFHDEVSPAEARSIAEHIQQCESCAKEAEDVKKIIEALHSLPEAELPEGYHNMLMEKLAQEAKVVPFPVQKKPQYKWRQFSLIAAAALLVVAVGGAKGILGLRQPETAGIQNDIGAVAEMQIDIQDKKITADDTQKKQVLPPETPQAVTAQSPQPIKAKASGQTPAVEPQNTADTKSNTPQGEPMPMQASIEQGDAPVEEKRSMLRSVYSMNDGSQTNEVTVDIQIALAVEKIDGTSDQIRTLTTDVSGIELETTDSAILRVSIPSANLQAFYDGLNKIGDMKTVAENTEEKTDQIIDITITQALN